MKVNSLKTFKQIRELEEQMEKNPSPETQAKIDALNAKIDKMDETTKNNEDYWESVGGYKNIFVHRIECPVEIYEECRKRMKQAYEDDPVKSFGFWGYGAQIFIDKEFLPQLKIFDVKKMNLSQFLNEYSSLVSKRYMKPRMKMTPKEEEEWEQRRIAKEEKKALEEQKKREREEYYKKRMMTIDDPESVD